MGVQFYPSVATLLGGDLSRSPGPVVIDIPKDVQQKRLTPVFPATVEFANPYVGKVHAATDEQLKQVLSMIAEAKRQDGRRQNTAELFTTSQSILLLTLQMELPEWKYEEGAWREVDERIEAALARLPGVGAVTRASGAPPDGGVFFGDVEVEGRGTVDGARLFFGVDSAFSALVQRDIKRALAYSTMSQIGYMFLALGVGEAQAGDPVQQDAGLLERPALGVPRLMGKTLQHGGRRSAHIPAAQAQ